VNVVVAVAATVAGFGGVVSGSAVIVDELITVSNSELTTCPVTNRDIGDQLRINRSIVTPVRATGPAACGRETARG
jgi:hypothetical protein